MGSSLNLLNEHLLRQNAELTGFVSRLTEEKNDLRNQLLRLEEELHRHRQRNFNTTTVSERERLNHNTHTDERENTQAASLSVCLSGVSQEQCRATRQ